MFTVNKRLRRRVFISHDHGELRVRIDRRPDRVSSIGLLFVFTGILVSVSSTIIGAIFRNWSTAAAWYALAFLMVLLLWYLLAMQDAFWTAFGIEEISVHAGTLTWVCTALWWKRTKQFLLPDITDVEAVLPWHSLTNRVELVAAGQRHTTGERLLKDETVELALTLKHAAGLTNRPGPVS